MKLEIWRQWYNEHNGDTGIVHDVDDENHNVLLAYSKEAKEDTKQLLLHAQKTHYLLTQALPELKDFFGLEVLRTRAVDKKLNRLVRRIEKHLETTGIKWDEAEIPLNIEAIQRDQSEDNHKHDYDGDYPQSVCKICGVMRGDDALETGEADES
jgi:hypothetical protein